MGMPKFDKPIDAASKAWCQEPGCGWKAWGIWAHRSANEHYQKNVGGEDHIVYVTEPEGKEQRP